MQKIINREIKITPCFYFNYKKSKLSLIRYWNSLISSFLRLLRLKTASYLTPTGSITLECSLALPIFMFFCINMMSLISIIGLHSNIESALHQEVCDAAVKSYVVNAGEQSLNIENAEVVNSLVSNISILGRVKSRVGTDYLNRSLIDGGSGGIHISFGIPEEDSQDTVDVTLSYTVKPLIGVIGFNNFKLTNRCRMKAWTGYNPADSYTYQKDLDTEEMVYVTEYGTVFHRDKECSYLNPSITSTSINNISSERNKWGEKYYCCEACGKKAAGEVYITNHGNRYHSSKDCCGLKRTISRVPLSKVGGMGPCSRCG